MRFRVAQLRFGVLSTHSLFAPPIVFYAHIRLMRPTDCGEDNFIKPKEPIQCHSCGYRILYKQRTKRSEYYVPRVCLLITQPLSSPFNHFLSWNPSVVQFQAR